MRSVDACSDTVLDGRIAVNGASLGSLLRSFCPGSRTRHDNGDRFEPFAVPSSGTLE